MIVHVIQLRRYYLIRCHQIHIAPFINLIRHCLILKQQVRIAVPPTVEATLLFLLLIDFLKLLRVILLVYVVVSLCVAIVVDNA